MKFGPFSFDPEAGSLTREGAAVTIGHRGTELLRVLVARRGEPVGKQDLMDAAWPGQAVEESNLTVQIAALRKALGTTPEGHDWIATVPRIGYRFIGAGAPAPASGKPSIAVLPFENISSDPEQAFFAAGLSDDLVTDLSKVAGLTVIARNSSFAMRDRRGDIRGIARDLGASFIVEGSVRRAADKVRINVQLIEGADMSHVWAERFDGELADVFALQDQVVGQIVRALSKLLSIGEAPKERRPVDLAAYDAFVRGRAIFLTSPEGFRKGVSLLHKAAELDPAFAEPHSWIAMSLVQEGLHWGADARKSIGAALASARRAVELDPENAGAFAHLGYALAFTDDLAGAEANLDRSLQINPSYADGMLLKAELMVIEGRPAEGVELVRAAMRLNPYPPSWYDWMLGFALYADGRDEEVVAALSDESALRAPYCRILAASLGQLGQLDEARRIGGIFLTIVPDFSIAKWLAVQRLRRSSDAERFATGYRLAGLPE